MATGYRERWTRAEGVMVAPGLNPEAVREHLAGRGVVARLEWYPRTEHLLAVAVAVDEAGRVAITPPRRGGVVRGVSLRDVVHDLVQTFGAEVLMDGADADEHDPGEMRAPGSAPPEAVVPDPEEWDEHDARTVVVTPLAGHDLPAHADLLGRPLTILDTGQRRLVMTTGPGKELGVHGWPDDAYPFLRLQVDDEDRTALLGLGPDDVVVHSWQTYGTVVPGSVDEPGPALRAMIEAVLGDRAAAEAFAAAFDADTGQVLAAMGTPSAAGLAAFTGALGLPGVVVDVLEGRLAPEDVPGAGVHRPTGVTGAVSRSVGRRPTGPGRPGAGFWRPGVQLLEDRPRLVRAIGAVEAAVGVALLGRSFRGAAPRARRLGTALGVGLVLDAVAGLALGRLVRRGR